jgi:hypothetical protein
MKQNKPSSPSEVEQTTQPSLGQYVAGLKASRDKVSDREAFLERCQRKYNPPTVAGFPMVGLGGSCGKPAFELPFVIRFNRDTIKRLEGVAEQFNMFVEYGAYPHFKLKGSSQEIAAVQDWTSATLIFLRPSYSKKEELLTAIWGALKGSADEQENQEEAS